MFVAWNWKPEKKNSNMKLPQGSLCSPLLFYLAIYLETSFSIALNVCSAGIQLLQFIRFAKDVCDYEKQKPVILISVYNEVK